MAKAKPKSDSKLKKTKQRKAEPAVKGPRPPKPAKGEHPVLRQLSKICLPLPEAVRRDLNGHADFRIHGKCSRPLSTITMATVCIKHSLCFGAYLDGRQIGFARVVTDFVRYAHLLDVFVLPDFRGRGIGKVLMEKIMAHPELQTIVRFSLGTQDGHGLYAQFGFTAPNPERQRELLRPQARPVDGAAEQRGCDKVTRKN